jgi:hypothetical protein
MSAVRGWRVLMAGVGAILLWLGLGVVTARAQTMPVASLSDTAGQSGDCTLLEAIANADGNTQVYSP